MADNKQKYFTYLDSEFEAGKGHTDFGKYRECFLDESGVMNLTFVAELLGNQMGVDDEEASELAYEWADQTKYEPYAAIF